MDFLNIQNTVFPYQLYIDLLDGTKIAYFTSLSKPGYYEFELSEYCIDRTSGDSKGDIKINIDEIATGVQSYNTVLNLNVSTSFIVSYGKTASSSFAPRKFILRLQNPNTLHVSGIRALNTSAFVGSILLSFNVRRISDL